MSVTRYNLHPNNNIALSDGLSVRLSLFVDWSAIACGSKINTWLRHKRSLLLLNAFVECVICDLMAGRQRGTLPTGHTNSNECSLGKILPLSSLAFHPSPANIYLAVTNLLELSSVTSLSPCTTSPSGTWR